MAINDNSRLDCSDAFPEEKDQPIAGVFEPSQEDISKFQEDLTHLINKHSMENLGDTPDYILAEYMVQAMVSFCQTCIKRDKWHGFRPWDKQ